MNISGDFENLELTLPVTSASYYAQVIFHNTPETFTTGFDIDCNYTITPSLEPTTRDYVGIYKVGWRSEREYTCFDWSKMPKNYVPGQKLDLSIKFFAPSLPKDDGEFYQFCYVTNAGNVRGASTPFQFRVAGSDEYVEVEDDEDENILVIKTKTAVLEEKLQKATTVQDELHRIVDFLEQEKESLLGELIESQKWMNDLKLQNISLGEKEQAMRLEVEEMQLNHTDLILAQNDLKEKLAVLSEEKISCEKRVEESDDYILGLQKQIKDLINEKDALSGHNKSLQEEKELFKMHFTTSEDQVKGYLVEMDDLRKRLRDEEDKSTELKTESELLGVQLTEIQDKIGDHQLASEDDQTKISELAEKLHNCEDQLSATEISKDMLNVEVTTLKQTLTKLSDDLETSKSDCHDYKSQVSRNLELMNTYTERVNTLQKALDDKHEELSGTVNEYRKLQEMRREEDKVQKQEEVGPQFALSMAYETLKQRYDRARGQKEEIQRQLDDAINRLKQCEVDKDVVNGEMKERLRLGQEQYQEREAECQKLQQALKKAIRANKSRKSSEKEIEQHTDRNASSQSETDKLQMTSAPEASQSEQRSEISVLEASQSEQRSETSALEVSQSDLTEIIVETPSLVDQCSHELMSQINDLGQELETRQKKKQKYKSLYQDEKEKRSYLEKHYFSELEKKDKEIRRLKEHNAEVKVDYMQRVANQQCVIDQQQAALANREAMTPPRPMGPIFPPQMPIPGQMPPQHPMSPMPPQHQMPLMPSQHPMSPMPPQPMQYPMQMAPRPVWAPFGNGPCPPTQIPIMCPPGPVAPLPPSVLVAPPIPPRSRTPPSDTLTRDDAPANLATPLTPVVLDTPLQPQLTTEVNLAEFINGGAPAPGETVEEEEEERFHDAEEGLAAANAIIPGAPPTMRMCPVCNMVFPDAVPENEIIRHVETHMQRTCPMCNQLFDDTVTDQVFQEHVNTHFSETG